jgi:hypothetical protein
MMDQEVSTYTSNQDIGATLFGQYALDFMEKSLWGVGEYSFDRKSMTLTILDDNGNPCITQGFINPVDMVHWFSKFNQGIV